VIELLTWLEGSALGQAVRGAGVWSYAVINLLHIIGVATLFGSILILDLKLMGAFRAVPLAMISVPTVRLAATGCALAMVSGLCLLATNATEYIHNPFLLVKFGAILAGLVNVVALHRSEAWRSRAADVLSRRHLTQLRIGGAVSLAAWTIAVAAGRMLGFW
jgi:hypothetical protein